VWASTRTMIGCRLAAMARLSPMGDVHPGVVDDADARVVSDEPFDDAVGAVGGGSDGEHDLELARVVLGDDAGDGGLEVAGLVEHRHDVRDGRLRHPVCTLPADRAGVVPGPVEPTNGRGRPSMGLPRATPPC